MPVLPSSLKAAIKAYWTAQGLDASVGPLFSGTRSPGVKPPWVKLIVKRGNLTHTFDSSRIFERKVLLRVVANGGTDVEGRADLVEAAFVPSTGEGVHFDYAGGSTYRAELMDRISEPEPGYTRDGEPAYAEQIELKFPDERP